MGRGSHRAICGRQPSCPVRHSRGYVRTCVRTHIHTCGRWRSGPSLSLCAQVVCLGLVCRGGRGRGWPEERGPHDTLCACRRASLCCLPSSPCAAGRRTSNTMPASSHARAKNPILCLYTAHRAVSTSLGRAVPLETTAHHSRLLSGSVFIPGMQACASAPSLPAGRASRSDAGARPRRLPSPALLPREPRDNLPRPCLLTETAVLKRHALDRC